MNLHSICRHTFVHCIGILCVHNITYIILYNSLYHALVYVLYYAYAYPNICSFWTACVRQLVLKMTPTPGKELSPQRTDTVTNIPVSILLTICFELDMKMYSINMCLSNNVIFSNIDSHNHLRLHSKTSSNGGDYINASFVDVSKLL